MPRRESELQVEWSQTDLIEARAVEIREIQVCRYTIHDLSQWKVPVAARAWLAVHVNRLSMILRNDHISIRIPGLTAPPAVPRRVGKRRLRAPCRTLRHTRQNGYLAGEVAICNIADCRALASVLIRARVTR